MNIRTMALIGGTMAVAFASVVVACSSSGSGNPSGSSSSSGGSSSGTSSSGTSSSGTSSSGTSSSGTSSSGTSSSGGAEDAACAKPPVIHASVPDGGIYCPYSYNDATDSGIQYCATGTQECCLSGGGDAGPSICQNFDNSSSAWNSGYAGCATTFDAVWQCSNKADCVTAGPPPTLFDGGPGVAATDDAGALVCCLQGGQLESDTSCVGYNKTFFGGTTCQPASLCQGSSPSVSKGTSYENPLYVACITTADCPSASQTCQAIFTTGTPIGVCVPQ